MGLDPVYWTMSAVAPTTEARVWRQVIFHGYPLPDRVVRNLCEIKSNVLLL